VVAVVGSVVGCAAGNAGLRHLGFLPLLECHEGPLERPAVELL
jgi:hypothetical protein